jgi:DNA repair protein RadC
MAIADWPEQERPREKLLKFGAQSLSDAELLAIFLRTGTAGRSAIDLARGLLGTFGGVRGIIEAALEDFCAEPGMGSSKYAQLQAAVELSQRHMLETLRRSDCLTSSALTRNYIRSRMRAYTREVFLCLFLDNQHRVIAQEELFQS